MELDIKGVKVLIDESEFPNFEGTIFSIAGRGTRRYISFRKKIEGDWQTLYLHRVIMGLKKGDKRQVDHVNHNPFDNRKENLRICSRSENQHNQKIRETGKSKYKGVIKNTGGFGWEARIVFKNKKIYLGLFKTEEEAAKCYNEKAKELFGKYAYINRIENILT